VTTTRTVGRDDRITLRFLATPADTAAGGRSVAAGSVMEWIDKAAFACAVGWSGTYCVTAYVGNVRHRRPIPPGSLVEVHARIIHTGRTSMHVVATVSSGEVSGVAMTPATTCILVFVAKGADGRPAEVPMWEPASRSDRKLAAAALERIPSRAAIKTLLLDEHYTEASSAPRTTLRFLIPPSVVNFGGKAHGGTVIRWIDEAATACATAWTGDAAAIGVYSGGIHFLAPARIGDIAEVDARIIYTTERSMHVSIRVSTADPRTPHDSSVTTRCMSVFVVPSADGIALPVPEWVPESLEDVRLAGHAREIIRMRESIVPIPASLALEP
jgi:4-hydroxybenzoyl-CoA thioesterase